MTCVMRIPFYRHIFDNIYTFWAGVGIGYGDDTIAKTKALSTIISISISMYASGFISCGKPLSVICFIFMSSLLPPQYSTAAGRFGYLLEMAVDAGEEIVLLVKIIIITIRVDL